MNRLRIAVALLVTIVWAGGYVLAFVDRSYTPPAEVSGIMLGVVTWLFGTEIKDRIAGRNNNQGGAG